MQTTPTNFLWEGNFFSGATVGITNAGIATNNPLLVLSSDGLWRPATNSPALGAAASSYPAVTNDSDGQPRPTAKDAGCDQASTNEIVRRPLGPTDVGPVWMRSVGPIRTVAFVSNSVTLTWDSLPALTYQIQFSSNLLDWASVSQTISNPKPRLVGRTTALKPAARPPRNPSGSIASGWCLDRVLAPRELNERVKARLRQGLNSLT